MTEAPITITAEQTLDRAVKAYRDKLYSPEYLSEFMQAFWNHHGERITLSPSNMAVPNALYTEEQIRQFMGLDDLGRIGDAAFDLGFFLPKILSSPDDLILMGVGFPETRWVLRSNHNINNATSPFGWMRVDAGLGAPFLGTDEAELSGQINALRRQGQTVNIYALSGQAIKRIFDYYPDQKWTDSRLLLSSEAGGVLDADFRPDGRLVVRSGLLPDARYGYLGGRSFQV